MGPNGDIIIKGPYYDEEPIYSNVDLRELDKTRPFIPTLRDLRPENIDKLSNVYHDF